jgi:Xaa-Pro aminopeptidase
MDWTPPTVDEFAVDGDLSDVRKYVPLPEIDFHKLHDYRLGRIRSALRKAEAAMVILVNPVSLRYAADYRNYALYQSHIPTTYLFVPVDGPVVIHGAYDPAPSVAHVRAGRPLAYFDGGPALEHFAGLLSNDVRDYLEEVGTDNRRVAVEYVNPSITQALMRRGLEVIDGVAISESARAIKSEEEIDCMRWAIATAELGIARVRRSIKPGVTELQLWGLLNYVNIVNDGDWHDGRVLVSGPRTNPWCQEASHRRLESGDLVGLDTDMIGPFGYFADISRTFHCGPARPTKRQKQLYRSAVEEIECNVGLVRPGVSLREFQERAYRVPEAFHQNAYPCVIHGVGMCDEYPRVNPVFRGDNPYDGTLQPGMVICVESYMGAAGERDGVKLEQQVLVTEDGCEMLTSFPFEAELLG